MKGGIFVDTSAWYALVDAGDANHPQASAFFPKALAEYRELIASNHVIGETYTLVCSRLGYGVAWGFLRNVWSTRRLRIVFVSEQLEREAYGLLERYPDQTFSFVDGTSFMVMREQGVSNCFAFDRHFPAAGFVAFPTPTY